MKKLRVTAFLFTVIFILGISADSYADAAADLAGRVLAVKKNVFRVRDNSRENAAPKMQLLMKDSVETDKKSRTKLFFTDDSILNVGELSKVEIEEYIYSPEKNKSKSIYKLTEGYLKVVVGRSDLEIHTPTAVASARGTKFIVAVDTKCSTEPASLEKGMCEKFTRIIVLEGKVETWNIMQGVGGSVMVNSGQMSKVSSQKPPEAAKPMKLNITEQFTENTVVLSDNTTSQDNLPALLAGDTGVSGEGDASSSTVAESAASSSSPEPPPAPAIAPPVVITPPASEFTPVTININFP
jgi:hypothetical protein